MNYEDTLSLANEFRESIDEKMGGVVIPGNTRNRLFNAYYHLSLEHYCSLIHLLNIRFYASAAALLRPQYEAVIRGMYFHEHATERAIANFVSGSSQPTMATLVGAITSKLEKNKESSFYRTFQKIETLMNEFTHGGMHQINRRFTPIELITNFNENDKLILATTSLMLARLSLVLALGAAGKNGDAAEILSAAQTNNKS